jgi:hypothetical protein
MTHAGTKPSRDATRSRFIHHFMNMRLHPPARSYIRLHLLHAVSLSSMVVLVPLCAQKRRYSRFPIRLPRRDIHISLSRYQISPWTLFVILHRKFRGEEPNILIASRRIEVFLSSCAESNHIGLLGHNGHV